MDVTAVPENRRGKKRRLRNSRGTTNKLEAYYQKLLKDLRTIKTLERLTGRGPTLVGAAVNLLTSSPTHRDETVYQLFLRDILRLCGRGLTLLCAASLGKQRVNLLNEDQRTDFVQYLKQNRDSLEYDQLELLAEEYGVPLPDDSRLRSTPSGPRGWSTRNMAAQPSPPPTSRKSDTDNLLSAQRYAPPSRAQLRPNDLYTFLEHYHGEDPCLAIRIPDDENETPVIELSREMCQGLLKHAMKRERQRVGV